jgi:hypothetical protein
MDVIEKAARALCLHGKVPGLWTDAEREDYFVKNRASYEGEVRAVLLAIREPSEAMKAFGSSYTSSDYESAADCWQAMIDRALSE